MHSRRLEVIEVLLQGWHPEMVNGQVRSMGRGSLIQYRRMELAKALMFFAIPASCDSVDSDKISTGTR